MRPLAFLSIAAVLSSVCLGGRAQGQDQAAGLLRRGVALRREHRNEEALDLFQRAYSLSPSAIAQAQVALAEQALGLWLQAERDLEAALADRRDPWLQANQRPLDEASQEIEQHLGWLTVSVDAPDAEVDLDDRRLAAASEQRVAAGPCVLSVRARGYIADVRHIRVAAGAHERVTVALEPLSVPPPGPAESGLKGRPGLRLADAPEQRPVGGPRTRAGNPAATPEGHPVESPAGPIALALVGAASFGLGTFAGLQALGQKQALDDLCDASGCAAGAAGRYADARRSALFSTAAMGAGVASIAVGTTWWLVDRSRATGSLAGPSVRPVGPIALGSLGLLSIGAATYFGVRAYADKSARDTACASGGCGSAALADDADARASATLSTIGGCVGGALLASGIAWWWITGRRNPTAALVWHPSPWLGPRQDGLSVEGQFR